MSVALKKDLELMRSKFNETSEKLMEKSRQYQKLQVSSVPGLACCMRQKLRLGYIQGQVAPIM